LFAHVDAWQWNPDLIWFDNLRSVRTPNWYVQQLYGLYKGTEVLRAASGRDALSGQNGLYASAVRDEDKKEIILKIGNSSNQMQRMKIELSGLKKYNPDAKWIMMQANDLNVVNTLDEPFKIVPGEASFMLTGTEFEFMVKPQSFNVLIISEQ
jgi:alpha-L-arabinofuranosidase